MLPDRCRMIAPRVSRCVGAHVLTSRPCPILAASAQKGGNPQEIGPKIRKIRKAHEDRIGALLSDAQKKQWKELLGKPLDLGD